MSEMRTQQTVTAQVAVETLRARGFRCSGDRPPRAGEYTVNLVGDRGEEWLVQWQSGPGKQP